MMSLGWVGPDKEPIQNELLFLSYTYEADKVT